MQILCTQVLLFLPFRSRDVALQRLRSRTISRRSIAFAPALIAGTHHLLVNGNEGIREYCVTDDTSAFLKVRDVFTLKSARDNSLKYFQVTHTKSPTVGAHFTGADKEFRKEQLERQLGKDLNDGDVINVIEFKETYSGRIERLGGSSA